LRHRPSVLPILSAWKYGKEAAEQKCVDSLPRKGNNKSQLSSALRFAYYYTDYLLGQLLIYVKYMLRGYVVLYDRYYFDFVVDGKRSNIRISPRFIRQLYRFVYKPQLNVFLYAAPEIILKRKQELSAEDIVQLTDQYKILFDRLGSQQRYICIENMDKQATIDRIEQAYIQLN
jgi:thymidylate kinase